VRPDSQVAGVLHDALVMLGYFVACAAMLVGPVLMSMHFGIVAGFLSTPVSCVLVALVMAAIDDLRNAP
jgi:hypothetical protein